MIYSCVSFCNAHCVCALFSQHPLPPTLSTSGTPTVMVTLSACCFCLTRDSELQGSTSLDSHNQLAVSYHHPVQEDSGKQVTQTHPGTEWQQRKVAWVTTSSCPPWKCSGCLTAWYLLILGCVRTSQSASLPPVRLPVLYLASGDQL